MQNPAEIIHAALLLALWKRFANKHKMGKRVDAS